MAEYVDFPGDTVVPRFPKIYSPFKRDMTPGPNKNKLMAGVWYEDSFGALQNIPWIWTEKLDGTNIRIHYDGLRVSVAGRSDRAELNSELVGYIQENLTEELFEQKFQDNPVTLYGEGLGAGIQKAGVLYSPTKKFVLFDVRAGNTWVPTRGISDIANSFGIDHAHHVFTGNVHDAIELVSWGLKSTYGDFFAEGLVGVPMGGLLNHRGGRINMKLKHCDFGPGSGWAD